jgi:hypothetical protein
VACTGAGSVGSVDATVGAGGGLVTSKDAGGRGPGELSLTRVEVDLNGLADLRLLINQELHHNLRPNAQRISGEHRHGVAFALRAAGARVAHARGNYADALTASIENLRRYVQVSRALVDGIATVTTNYRGAEADSAAVLAVLRKALEAVEWADLAPPADRGVAGPWKGGPGDRLGETAA